LCASIRRKWHGSSLHWAFNQVDAICWPPGGKCSKPKLQVTPEGRSSSGTAAEKWSNVAQPTLTGGLWHFWVWVRRLLGQRGRIGTASAC
jgi:hypothetical protein